MNEKSLISFSDIMTWASIPIEMLQLFSMGPDLGSYLYALIFAGSYASLELNDIDLVNGEVYWIMLHSVYAIVSVWILSSLVIIFDLDYRFRPLS